MPGLQILTIDSTWDEATRVAFEYRRDHLVPALRSAGHSVVTLTGPLARRGFVVRELAPGASSYVSGSGHGDEDTFTGDFLDPIFDVGSYAASEVADRVVHLLACDSALTLGPDMVRQGCRAFIGYSEQFILIPEHAEDFLVGDIALDLALAAGRTVEEAYDVAVSLFDATAQELRRQNKNYRAALVERNRDLLQCPVTDSRLGDPSARIG